MDKKGNLAVVFGFIVTLVLGFVISFNLKQRLISAVILVIIGLISGKIISNRKPSILIPVVLVVIGFVIGYMFGDQTLGNLVIMIIFILSTIAGYIANRAFKE